MFQGRLKIRRKGPNYIGTLIVDTPSGPYVIKRKVPISENGVSGKSIIGRQLEEISNLFPTAQLVGRKKCLYAFKLMQMLESGDFNKKQKAIRTIDIIKTKARRGNSQALDLGYAIMKVAKIKLDKRNKQLDGEIGLSFSSITKAASSVVKKVKKIKKKVEKQDYKKKLNVIAKVGMVVGPIATAIYPPAGVAITAGSALLLAATKDKANLADTLDAAGKAAEAFGVDSPQAKNALAEAKKANKKWTETKTKLMTIKELATAGVPKAQNTMAVLEVSAAMNNYEARKQEEARQAAKPPKGEIFAELQRRADVRAKEENRPSKKEVVKEVKRRQRLRTMSTYRWSFQ